MKSFVKIFLLIIVLIAITTAVFAAPAEVKKDTAQVTLVPTLYKDLLILKADKSFMGAVIEVHDSTGTLITSSEIQKRKTLVDFYNIPDGSYTISVVKNNERKDFTYTKRQDSEILH